MSSGLSPYYKAMKRLKILPLKTIKYVSQEVKTVKSEFGTLELAVFVKR
jgi:hypothetical protein